MLTVKSFGLKPVDKFQAISLKKKNIGVYVYFKPIYDNETLPTDEIYKIDNTRTLQQNVDSLKIQKCFPIQVYTYYYTDNIEYSYEISMEDKFIQKSLFE